ncbi:MAG: MCE family protein [Rhodospirillales bacterium]|nr:MAG: MCE family protein [Rhodospirillales bacterium]
MMASARRFRYANEAVGALVIVAALLLIGAALQAGVLRDWLQPGVTLRVVLPAEGSFGLSRGAAVEILGTRAGEVQRVVISPDDTLYAEVVLDERMAVFVRTDSRAIIRKQFGIAGAAYLDITRGNGAPLDWDYAVIRAEADRAATDTVSELIKEVQDMVRPILEDVQRTAEALATFAEQMQEPDSSLQRTLANVAVASDRIAQGEGVVGRLLTDERLVVRLEESLEQVGGILGDVRAVTAELSGTAEDVRAELRRLPQLLARADAILASAQAVMQDLERTSPDVPGIAKDVRASTTALPALLIQTQQTTYELERLLAQLRRSWLFGGGSGEAEVIRLPAGEVRP